jgi:hypothetical protein
LGDPLKKIKVIWIFDESLIMRLASSAAVAFQPYHIGEHSLHARLPVKS